MGLLLYPYFLVVFWYHEFVPAAVRRSFEIFVYILELLSVSLLITTLFKPLKNEYREGLVVFSVIMGVIVKLLLLSAEFLILALFLFIFAAINLVIIFLPLLIAVIFLLYTHIVP